MANEYPGQIVYENREARFVRATSRRLTGFVNTNVRWKKYTRHTGVARFVSGRTIFSKFETNDTISNPATGGIRPFGARRDENYAGSVDRRQFENRGGKIARATITRRICSSARFTPDGPGRTRTVRGFVADNKRRSARATVVFTECENSKAKKVFVLKFVRIIRYTSTMTITYSRA